MRDEVKDALLRLTDGDEEATEEFAGLVDNTNLEIEQERLITREGDPDPEGEPAPEADPDKDEPEGEPVDQLIPQVGEIELDDEAMERIADVAVKSEHIVSVLKARDEKIDELQATLDELSEKIDSLTDLPGRVSALELDEDEKREVWLEDQPRKKKTTKVSYRPRNAKVDDEKEPSMADTAETTLAALPKH